MNILRTKSVEQSIRDTEEPEHRLRKVLGFAYGMHHSHLAREEIEGGGTATMKEWEQPEARARNRR